MENNTYGLTSSEINKTIKKLQINLLYLFSKFVHFDDGDGILLGDITSNAILHKDKYVASIYNRVNTLNKLAKERQLVSMMITLTISSKKTQRNVKDSLKELSSMFRKITKDRSWSKIDRDERIYFKVIEPQETGVPHMHILLWVPKHSVSSLVKNIYDFYPSPMAKISSSYIPNDFKPCKEDLFSDKEYFHKAKGRPIVKIKKYTGNKTKYLLKQFRELTQVVTCIDDIDNIQNIPHKTLWYVHHKVKRITISQSLIPDTIYKKIYWYDSLLALTKMYKKGEISTLHLVEKSIENKTDTKQVKTMQLILNGENVLWSKKGQQLTQFVHNHQVNKERNNCYLDDVTSNILHYGLVERKIINNDLSSLEYVIKHLNKVA